MKGSVIAFDPGSNSGAISGYDGKRYDFAVSDWHGAARPERGDLVDFIPDGQRAAQIYLLEPEYVRPGFWQFYFSPYGRTGRSEYWLRYFLPIFVIGMVLNIISVAGQIAGSAVVAAGFGFLDYLFSLVTFWPGIAVLIKRIHDRDKSGWLVLLPLVLIIVFVIGLVAGAVADSGAAVITAVAVAGIVTAAIAVWFFVEFGCLRGTVGANRYGPDPVRAH